MGYADPSQVGSGLRQRLYSRAFIIGDAQVPEDRFVYLVLDTAMGDTAVRNGILEGLAGLGDDYAAYTQQNVAVTGTHSHSGPGAWLNYLLPQITSKGFNKQSYQALVDGALLSIQRAHTSLSPGYLTFGSTDLLDANINRSPYAYLANPESERQQYEHDVDKTLTMLKFQKADGEHIGALTWFPVHGTSMLENNTLASGDNKGAAAVLFEQNIRDQFNDFMLRTQLDKTKRSAKVSPDFVAGFSQSNVGDTTPNVLGAFCEAGRNGASDDFEDGDQCNFQDSTCGGKAQPCHGRGPEFREDDRGASSCFEIGRRQFVAAKALWDSSSAIPLSGPIASLHSFKDFSNFTFVDPLNTTTTSYVNTCSAALGYGFAGGTTDGPGAFDFTQNNTGDGPSASNPLWTTVRDFLHDPSDEQRACQEPKPILLDVGATTRPYQWAPNIVDIQLLRVGQLIIIVSPGEATTMSGRRWKSALASAAPDIGIDNPLVVLGGPANSYTHYIATKEEYSVQRYEGASTMYGPHTLSAYINATLDYLPYLSSRDKRSKLTPLAPGPSPPINTNNSLSFINPVLLDRPAFFHSFGDVLSQPSKRLFRPGETVSVRFVGANPRNNLRLEETFAAVEKQGRDNSWTAVRDDADWSLVYRWARTSTVLGTSEVTIEWAVEDGAKVAKRAEQGVYRIKYYGDAKSVGGQVQAFEGVSDLFEVS